MANECVVYHKHLAGMDKSDGYIGISKSFEERMKQHNRDAFVKNSIYTVHKRMRMYGDEVITSKIFEGSINECFDYEEELRPRWHMGWNMAIGGGRPGSGWKPGPDWMDNRIWHPQFGEEILTSSFTSGDWACKYGEPNGTNICKVLTGRIPKVKGWELANSQLANSVKDRYHRDWDTVYIKKDKTIALIYKSGHQKYAEYIGLKSSGQTGLKQLINQSKDRLRSWELSTEQEWLETTERLEFK